MDTDMNMPLYIDECRCMVGAGGCHGAEGSPIV